MEAVHITGMGFITSIGNSIGTVTESLRELKHGIDFHPELQGDDSPVKLAGTVKEFDLVPPIRRIGYTLKNIMCQEPYSGVFPPMSFMPGVHSGKPLMTQNYPRLRFRTLKLECTHHPAAQCVPFINISKKWMPVESWPAIHLLSWHR